METINYGSSEEELNIIFGKKERLREKICKLLNLTTSPFDNEALNAIRLANQMVMSENLVWDNLLVETFPSSDSKQDLKISMMINVCLEKVKSDSGLKFIRSIKSFYDEQGYLTDRQIEALRNWYTRL